MVWYIAQNNNLHFFDPLPNGYVIFLDSIGDLYFPYTRKCTEIIFLNLYPRFHRSATLCTTFLQNATEIIALCDSYVTTKCGKSLLQNATSFLL